SIAVSTSRPPAAATSTNASSVAGLISADLWPDEASRNRPFKKSWDGRCMRATDSYAKTRWTQVQIHQSEENPRPIQERGGDSLSPIVFRSGFILSWDGPSPPLFVPILESATKKTGTVLQTFIRLLTPGLQASSKRIAQGMQAKQVLHSTAERPQPHSVERGVQKASDLAAIN